MANRAILVGRLGADPEVHNTQNDKKIVNMRVATSERWRDRDGERQERTEWHRVVIFNEGLAKVAEQYLKKGSQVYLEGKIITRKWEDQSGNDRYTTEIVLQAYDAKLELLGDGGGRQSNARDDDRSRSSGGGGGGGGSYTDLDDEIPFAPEWR